MNGVTKGERGKLSSLLSAVHYVRMHCYCCHEGSDGTWGMGRKGFHFFQVVLLALQVYSATLRDSTCLSHAAHLGISTATMKWFEWEFTKQVGIHK